MLELAECCAPVGLVPLPTLWLISEEDFEKHLHAQTGVWAVAPDKFHCYADVNGQTQKQVLKLRSHPWIPSNVVIRGFVFDLSMGELREVTPKEANNELAA